ncbi:hypothetical protein AB837_00022 [bacterium AB1]|nr:hypothetical protein AB837_00022 [bacterium AB1]
MNILKQVHQITNVNYFFIWNILYLSRSMVLFPIQNLYNFNFLLYPINNIKYHTELKNYIVNTNTIGFNSRNAFISNVIYDILHEDKLFISLMTIINTYFCYYIIYLYSSIHCVYKYNNFLLDKFSKYKNFSTPQKIKFSKVIFHKNLNIEYIKYILKHYFYIEKIKNFVIKYSFFYLYYKQNNFILNQSYLDKCCLDKYLYYCNVLYMSINIKEDDFLFLLKNMSTFIQHLSLFNCNKKIIIELKTQVQNNDKFHFILDKKHLDFNTFLFDNNDINIKIYYKNIYNI